MQADSLDVTPRAPIRDRPILLALVVALAVVGATLTAWLSGRMGVAMASLIGMDAAAAMSLIAAWRFTGARSVADGRQRRAFTMFALGCALWGAGAVPYSAFILTGGSPVEPGAWSQAGFALAYIPWFCGLWLLRQPILADGRRTLLDVGVVELGAFTIVGAGGAGLLWNTDVGVVDNAGLLAAAVADTLLVIAACNAVRRVSFTHRAFSMWLLAGTCLMLIADAGTAYAATRGPISWMAGSSIALYCVVFATFAIASGRPAGVRDATLSGERVTFAIAMTALALAGPCTFYGPDWLRWPMWIIVAVMAWRMLCMIERQRVPDRDPLTGMYELKPLLRHGARLINAATEAQPVAVVGVDLTAFGTWNSTHGFRAGDAVLKHLSELLVDLDTGPGVWGRVSSNRFSWIGVVDGPGEARRVARMICDAAADNRAGLAPRTGLAICPQDAVTPESARAAVREAMDAARDAGENLVAFDGGLMDGANPTGAPSASFRARRKRIAAIMDAPDALTPVYQPIVHMATLAVSGYEALTRVNAEPRLGPDQWITEAKRVGLGLEFEAECIRRALANRADLPAGAYLSVNSSPELVLSGRLDTLPPTGPLEWLMIEITEHEAVTDYGELGNRLDNLRGRGARVAVDDLGAGHSTLRHVMQMSPDFAKLDRSLVEGIDRDGAKQALVRSMVAFSNEVECSLVAEGVETPAEMQTLRGLGMDLGQGYLFQRPEPAIAPRLSEDRRRVIAAIRAA